MPSVQTLDDYLTESWSVLRRTPAHLPAALTDIKLGEAHQAPLYIAPTEDEAVVRQMLTEHELSGVELRVLAHGPDLQAEDHGLLYLPHPYIVPGGRFNEMYGWDSYFINVGLLLSGQVEQARRMVENHLYQVKHYGKVLNANRTYYLTRSQPPFLASMVWDVFEKTQDRQWLNSTLPELEATYEMWTAEPHLTPETGLSRYYDMGEGPAPEVVIGERDEEGLDHYERIRRVFRDEPEGLGYPLELYYSKKDDALTPLFYKGDRTMRESGYDPSDRFGRFNLDVIHYNPVDLNALLYLHEQLMGKIEEALGRGERAKTWVQRSVQRAKKIDQYLWSPEDGLYYDFNIRTSEQRPYPFATTYFPLWVGCCSQERAAQVAANTERFLTPGGLVTSLHRSGNQWDSPFGWAPLQMVAADGLKRYGYTDLAQEIAERFCSLVEEEFARTGTVVEKYDVVSRTSEVSSDIEFGYSTNEVGFGWTNGVYLHLKNQ